MQWTKDEFCGRVLEAESSLYRVAISILRSDQDCADAMQEGILKAWLKLGSLKDERYFKSWLTRIVINECYQIIRKNRHMAGWNESFEDAAELASVENNDAPALEALRTLDEKYRLPLVLQVIEGYSTREIGNILGIPASTARVRLYRGKALMREKLKGEN